MAYHTSRSNLPQSIIHLYEKWTLVLFVTVVALGVSCQPVAPTPPPPRLANLSFGELKERAFSPTYDDLFRNNESHVGKLVYYRAKIIQVIDNGKGLFQLRADITEGR